MIVNNINPYLVNAPTVWIKGSKNPISDCLTRMYYGNKPADGGFLHLTLDEKNDLLEQHPEASPIIKQIIGSQEALKGIERYCLWITDDLLTLALSTPNIKARIDNVKNFRLASKAPATSQSKTPAHRFFQLSSVVDISKSAIDLSSLVIPQISSERRIYYPALFSNSDAIINNRAFMIPNPSNWHLSVLSSTIHRVWLNAIGGKLEDRYSYSNTMVWNTFPMPSITDEQKEKLNQTGQGILNARHYHPDLTLGDMYNPENMGPELLEAHKENDKALEAIFREEPFKSDEERLSHLFECYTEMTNKAGVSCVVIGMRNTCNEDKILMEGHHDS